jgi:DNA repair exonuclease SbcCD nuclease subunit
MPYPRHAIAIMNEIALLSPTCVLYTGDAFWGYKASRQETLNDIDRFRALAATTGVPLYNVPGNHETQSDVGAVAILKEKGHDLWGSFDIGPYHFVALNTDEVNREGRVTDEQLDWLG